jgi:hypothetical protein
MMKRRGGIDEKMKGTAADEWEKDKKEEKKKEASGGS